MSALHTLLLPATPDAFWKWGRFVFGSALGLGLLIVAFLAWKAPSLLPFLPVVLLGGAGALYLFRHPLLNLCVVLLGFGLVADFEEGLQITEVLYGLYSLGFLAYWFVVQLLEERRFLRTPEDKALLLFLVLITLSIPLTVLFGGSLRSTFSEWAALLMFGLYFPVRDACIRYRRGLSVVLLSLLTMVFLIAVRNLLNYQAILANAAQAWQVASGRVYTNDGLLMISSVFTLSFLLFSRRLRERALLLGCFLVFFSGLLLTQSRTYWVTFAVGVFVVFLLIDRRDKVRLVLLGIAGLVGLLGVASFFLGDYLLLVISGLFDRLLSLQSATSRDISLINRFLESKAVWEHIKVNPILGYGMGVEYRFYDITYELSRSKSFVHNGYVSLWYRFGLWGLGLVLYTWAALTWRGIQSFRTRNLALYARLTGLAVAACLIAFTLSTNTANPFFLNDSTFAFGVLFGLAGGAYQRSRRLEAMDPTREVPA